MNFKKSQKERYQLSKRGRLALLALVILCLIPVGIVGVGKLTKKLSADMEEALTVKLTETLIFRLKADGQTIDVHCYTRDGQQYTVYLPAWAEMDNLMVYSDSGLDVRLNDLPVQEGGISCDAFALDENYPLYVSKGRILTLVKTAATIRFTRSANVSTMFIHTESGSMEAVNNDKSRKENCGVRLYSADGKLNYQSQEEQADRIRGRGNWNWMQEKKPYNLYLSSASDLLGLGAAKKWALISNVLDVTNLRNRMVYLLAGELGQYSGFSPDCTYVDVYLNGSYNGLYLLCEKVEVKTNRLEVSKDSILFDLDLASSMSNLTSPFLLNEGSAVEIKYPDPCSDELLSFLHDRLTDFQSALMSKDGINQVTGRSWQEYIDLDSWARKYLIEEIFLNYDAGACSQYFFWNVEDDLIYAGPCWDYDNTLGASTQKNTNMFIAQRMWKNEQMFTPWYGFLMQKNEFREYVINLYRKEFLPALNELMDTTLPAMAETLRCASEMNRDRWCDIYDGQALYRASRSNTVDSAVAYMADLLSARVQFLNSAWVDGVTYRTITFLIPGDYHFYAYPDGTAVFDLPSPVKLGVWDSDGTWYVEGSGEVFVPGTVLTEDLSLYTKSAS